MADLPPNVTLAQLSYFVAVAEELNFTRAAERLHVSQSPLSQAIRALETNLGVTLLNRTSRHVELTEAGEELLPAARAALGAVEHAVRVAREAASGEPPVVRVGFLAYGACEVIDQSLAAFAPPVSMLKLETRQTDFSDPTAGLTDRAVDAAFLRLPVSSHELDDRTAHERATRRGAARLASARRPRPDRHRRPARRALVADARPGPALAGLLARHRPS